MYFVYLACLLSLIVQSLSLFHYHFIFLSNSINKVPTSVVLLIIEIRKMQIRKMCKMMRIIENTSYMEKGKKS